eukprot:CAMPEP_0119313332 /NCGR_PEP_ID=MMETSP1333-20130426/28717_1 /TAXON_ID=418940 /ORGANISM="Scyphosphaera apsteinii, Strain RCC1455" /LENGTH=116 /DNA_ID=CAMNT_0007318141 /DNA_START=224 /DNA_END=574 /DNA_ORIENTATION=-
MTVLTVLSSGKAQHHDGYESKSNNGVVEQLFAGQPALGVRGVQDCRARIASPIHCVRICSRSRLHRVAGVDLAYPHVMACKPLPELLIDISERLTWHARRTDANRVRHLCQYETPL